MDYIKELENYDMEEMHKIVNCTPNAEDMQEALLGMDRIEHFYDLQASDMANGLVAGQQFETRMSASDCLALANYMYNQSEFRRAAQWFRLALHYIKVPRNSIVAKFYAPQRQELQKMFLISRLQEGSIDNLNNYLKELSQETENSLTHLRPKPPPNAIERGCRGQFPDRPKLVCRYNTTTTPFMRIAPLKEEEISRNPLIWLYHDVISDNEIVEITNLTRDDMIEGFTDNYTTPEQENRIFQVKIFEGVGGKLDKALVNRMADISGLNVGNHTELAIINYGLGSYFQEHSDYRDLQMHPELMEEGNRLFTFLFYMTDVPVGGATIFPAINITIQPKKGAALFWYNLHNNCEPNPLARHAVCPMIMGNRWERIYRCN
ncbi:hypothetical protein KR009_000306 [Drosophila setifemur]|nr:hypothetical protein KR009_000306 [Drosophila setifemur]